MKQPELGQKIATVRKDKNLTQEELVEMCHVSVRTIQRIESGEVTPRLSTVKIILAALDINIDSIRSEREATGLGNYLKHNLLLEKVPGATLNDYNTFLHIAWIAGVIYLALGIVEGAMDYTNYKEGLVGQEKLLYAMVKAIGFISFFLFMRGFVTLGVFFDNSLLRVASSFMIVVISIVMLGDIYLVYFPIEEPYLLVVYATESVMQGAVGILLGLGLMKLQDGMGDASRIAGILEILAGCALVVVFLFVLGYLLLIPATILEIIILFKGYEFVRQQSLQQTA